MAQLPIVFNDPLDKAVEILGEIEYHASDLLADQERIVELDKRRNKNREALRAIEKKHESKVWLCFGHMFIRVEKERAKAIIEKDQNQLTQDINNLRDEAKNKLAHLRNLEGKPKDEGYDLKALSPKEIAALREVLPRVI